jgi:hypothetical protein
MIVQATDLLNTLAATQHDDDHSDNSFANDAA